MSMQPVTFSFKDPHGNRLYKEQYEHAGTLYDEGRDDECLEAAKYNLTDPTLPPYYRSKDYILIVYAVKSWTAAEPYLDKAKEEYAKCRTWAARLEDEDDLRVLEKIRQELERFEDARREDLEGPVFGPATDAEYDEHEGRGREMHGIVDDDEIMEDDKHDEPGHHCEGPVELAQVEKEDEGNVEHLNLPIHSKNKATNTSNANGTAVAEDATATLTAHGNENT